MAFCYKKFQNGQQLTTGLTRAELLAWAGCDGHKANSSAHSRMADLASSNISIRAKKAARALRNKAFCGLPAAAASYF